MNFKKLWGLGKKLLPVLFMVLFTLNHLHATNWTAPTQIPGTSYYCKWPSMDSQGNVVTYLYDNTAKYDDKKIMVVEYANGQWQNPVMLGENGHYSTESFQWLPWETRPVVNANGNLIAYVGGFETVVDQGGGPTTVINPQIYISEKINGQWSTPSRLDVGIPRIHHMLSLSADGNTLAFSSYPANIFGESPVLYIITRTNGVWSNKVALTDPNYGGAYNPYLSADGKKVIWLQNNKIWFSELTDTGWTKPLLVVDNPVFGVSIEYPKLSPEGNFITYWNFPVVSSVMQPGHLYLVQRTPTGGWTQPTQITTTAVTPSHVSTGFAASNSLFSRQVYSRPVVSEDTIIAVNIEVADLTNTGWVYTPLTSYTSGYNYNANPVLSSDGRTLVFQGPGNVGYTVLLYSKASTSNDILIRSVSGRILYDGKPLKNVEVQLTGNSRNLTVTTDASGNFGFTGLTDGTYTVTPSKRGFVFEPQNRQVNVSGGSVASVDFSAFNATGTIAYTGSIKDSSLKPINADFIVQLFSDSNVSTTVEADGSFLLAGIPKGSDFQLKIIPNNAWFPTVISNIFNSQTNIESTFPYIIFGQSEYPSALQYQPSIVGKVISPSGNPISGASISCKNASENQTYSVAYYKDNKIDYNLPSTFDNGIFFCYGFTENDEVIVTGTRENYSFNTIRFKNISGSYTSWQAGEGYIIGTYESPPITSIELKQGWNFVSFPSDPENSSISAFFGDTLQNIRVIWGYDNETKGWKVYKANLQGSKFPILETIESGKGYWIYMNAPFVIDISNWSSASKTITLSTGWNLIGWNGADGISVMDALYTLGDKWEIIWGWENGKWKAKKRGADSLPEIEPLNVLNQGRAYWISMEEGMGWKQ